MLNILLFIKLYIHDAANSFFQIRMSTILYIVFSGFFERNYQVLLCLFLVIENKSYIFIFLLFNDIVKFKYPEGIF